MAAVHARTWEQTSQGKPVKCTRMNLLRTSRAVRWLVQAPKLLRKVVGKVLCRNTM